MQEQVEKLGDNTSHDVKPDFESGRGYYWMKQMYEIQRQGTPVKHWPRKPRETQAEKSFFNQTDIRLSRKSFSLSFSFNEDGKVTRE